MVEIRVSEKICKIEVERSSSPTVVVSVPTSSSWADLGHQLGDQLTSEELEMAKKIWCEDEFARTFESGDGFVAIRPALN